MTQTYTETIDGITTELRCGRWEDVLGDVVECDTLIVDAPYSARTHHGHDSAPTVAGRRDQTSPYDRSTHGVSVAGDHRINNGVAGAHRDGSVRRSIGYDGWTENDVSGFVGAWLPRVSGWFVTITDHVLAEAWASSLADGGRYVFVPLPWFAPGSRVRRTGDGPSSWTCWIVVARPSTDKRTGRSSGGFRDGTACNKWGTLPGGYVVTQDRGTDVVGQKPVALIRCLIRDYSRPGDLIVDPCAGAFTTGIAARAEGRSCIGAECDPETYAKAVRRIETPFTKELF